MSEGWVSVAGRKILTVRKKGKAFNPDYSFHAPTAEAREYMRLAVKSYGQQAIKYNVFLMNEYLSVICDPARRQRMMETIHNLERQIWR